MANKTLPTAEQLRHHFDYDPETGALKWKRPRANRVHVGEVAGCINPRGYHQVALMSRYYLVHRIVWCMMTGEWPPDQIDHKNRVRADNSWKNLRLANNADNACNTGRHRNNTSGFKGVHWDKRGLKWVAHIRKRRLLSLGRFDTAEEAYAAYCKAAVELHGEFANLG